MKKYYSFIFLLIANLQVSVLAFTNDDYFKGVMLANTVADAPEKLTLPKGWLDALFAANALTIKNNREYAGCLDFGISSEKSNEKNHAAKLRLNDLMDDLDIGASNSNKDKPEISNIAGYIKPIVDFQFEPFIEGMAVLTNPCENHSASAEFHTHPVESLPFSPADLEGLSNNSHLLGTLRLLIANDRKIYLLMPTIESKFKRGGISQVDTKSFYMERDSVNLDFSKKNKSFLGERMYFGLHCVANAFGIAYYAGGSNGELKKVDFNDCAVPKVEMPIKKILLNFKAFQRNQNESEIDADIEKYASYFKQYLGGITSRTFSLYKLLDSKFVPDLYDVYAFTNKNSAAMVQPSYFKDRSQMPVVFNLNKLTEIIRPIYIYRTNAGSEFFTTIVSCDSSVRLENIEYIADFVENGKCLFGIFDSDTFKPEVYGSGTQSNGVLHLKGRIQWSKVDINYEGEFLHFTSIKNGFFSYAIYGSGKMRFRESGAKSYSVANGKFFNENDNMMFEGELQDETTGKAQVVKRQLFSNYYKEKGLPSFIH